jgi:hypothetical protein
VTVLVALSVALWLLVRYYRAAKSSGLPVGPPVLDPDEDPLSIQKPQSLQTKEEVAAKVPVEVSSGRRPSEENGGSADRDSLRGESPERRAIAPAARVDHDSVVIEVGEVFLAHGEGLRAKE